MAEGRDMAEGAGADEDRQAVISSALLLGCGWGELRCAIEMQEV